MNQSRLARILPARLFCLPLLCGVFIKAQETGEEANAAISHGVIYHEEGRYGGWPANHGGWSWGDEILVGFTAAHYMDRQGKTHATDPSKPEQHLFARSRDGGSTWTIEDPAPQGVLLPRGAMLFGTPLPGVPLPPIRMLQEPIDFTHPDLALTFRMEDYRGNGQSFFYYSYDRGRNWNGPFALPLFGAPGVAARTDYIVNGPHHLFAFLTVAKANGRGGRTICAETKDGGVTWEALSFIGPEPEGYASMPASVRLNQDELLSVLRVQGGTFIAYHSRDNGKSWKLRNYPVARAANGRSNPCSLLKLNDGRLAIVYGYRAEPFGVRAKVSDDEGHSWHSEVILRDDAASWDIGYTRSFQRTDGKVVTAYYYHHEDYGPGRYIASTIWDPARLWPSFARRHAGDNRR